MHADEVHDVAPVGATLHADTLTFLFTDVEGSTPLWERHEATMRVVTARHDALLDALIVRHGGRRVKERGEGDSIFAVFPHPAGAVAAALAIAQAVQEEPWPAETPIRVRMGLHTGLAQHRDGDYYGPAINRCARIRGLGHGGQVLLSAATVALLRESLPPRASLRSLGLHSLKGLCAPEDVFQLCHPELPAEFPPLLSPQAPRHNLHPPLTPLIGRERELDEVLALLTTERLVTLVGAGGVGKTRLALTVAMELLDHYPHGVWVVELAPLTEPALVPGALMAALGLREEPGRPVTATLADHLKEQQVLLVLDNCEHLVAACAALVSALLRAAPRLRVLATSREGLHVSGEQRYRVPSLRVPDRKRPPSLEQMNRYEAVRLFVARAQARRRDFTLDDRNAAAVVEICAQLDGIPLAIELAAARTGSVPVESIAARLSERFRLLAGGPRDAPSRQQTLRATLDWSWELLDAQERLLLRRLPVFAGGWTLAAAELVCAEDDLEEEQPRVSTDLPCARTAPASGNPVPGKSVDPPSRTFARTQRVPGKSLDSHGRSYIGKWAVLDLLDGLVNKSLVQLEAEADGARYWLLESVRQYAAEQLQAASAHAHPEQAALRDRHLAWCLALAEEAAPLLLGPQQGQWLARLDREEDNLRAALGWACERPDGTLALRLAVALRHFWHLRGSLKQGRAWLARALACGEAPAALRAAGLNGAGVLAHFAGDLDEAATLLSEAITLYRTLADRRSLAHALNNVGLVRAVQGDAVGALSLYEESLIVLEQLQDRRGIASTLSNMGLLAWREGDLARATTLVGRCLAIERDLGDAAAIADSLDNLGGLHGALGDWQQAAALFEQALAIHRELQHPQGIARSLANLAEVALNEGNAPRAAPLYRESLQLRQEIGNARSMVVSVEGLAFVAVAQGAMARAATLLGAAAAWRTTLGAPLSDADQRAHARVDDELRRALGETAYAAASEAGRALRPEQAVAVALQPLAD